MKAGLQTFCTIAAMILVIGAARAQAPAAKPKPVPLGTDTEINLLKLEVQRLRGDIETMKGHVGRIVQYLQQRDTQSAAPQLPPQPLVQPQPQAAQPAAGFNPATAKFTISGAPTLGRADAPVTIVEFSDFECPFCQRHFVQTWPEIKRDYVDTGKVRYVFLDFPLEQIHFKARKAAEAAQCAAEQGKFWEMHDLLFAQNGNLDVGQYVNYAKKLGLEAFAFDLCLGSGKQAAKITRNLASGTAIGINATPSFVVTRTERGDIISGGNLITGAQPYEQFREAIDRVLGAK